jgi:hypothetical protein
MEKKNMMIGDEEVQAGSVVFVTPGYMSNGRFAFDGHSGAHVVDRVSSDGHDVFASRGRVLGDHWEVVVHMSRLLTESQVRALGRAIDCGGEVLSEDTKLTYLFKARGLTTAGGIVNELGRQFFQVVKDW